MDSFLGVYAQINVLYIDFALPSDHPLTAHSLQAFSRTAAAQIYVG
jgi:hypothetical protein